MRPVPGSAVPVRISAPDGRTADASAVQRALDALHSRLSGLESATRELGTAVGSRWLGRRLITATGIYTPTPGTTRVLLRMVGGGAGGGGGGSRGGAGGSSGVCLELVVETAAAITGGPMIIGAGGAGGGGGNPGSNGGAGGDTTAAINGTTYVARGGGVGGGGGDSLPGVPTAPATGTSSGGVSTYGLGGTSLFTSIQNMKPGDGGSSPLGAGGVGVSGATGNPGLAYGGGGAGGMGTNIAGGAGAPGIIVIDEYSE